MLLCIQPRVSGVFSRWFGENVCVSVCLRVGWGLGLCCLPKCMATHKCVSATMCHFKHMLPRSSPFGGSLICGTQPDSLWSDPGGQHSVVPRATWCSLGGKKLEICLCPYYHCLFCSLSTLTGEYNRCTYIHINVTIQMHQTCANMFVRTKPVFIFICWYSYSIIGVQLMTVYIIDESNNYFLD